MALSSLIKSRPGRQQAAPPDATASDEALLASIGNGDQNAMRHLYERHQARIYRYALSRLNDQFAAADILNEVMLDVWRQAVTFAGRSKVSTWMLGITRHKLIDHLRREGRRRAESFDEATADPDTVSAVDAIAGLQEAGRLSRCLQKLSEIQRETIHLAFFEDLSYPEIAVLTDSPEGTVKTRVFHAKQALKRCLGQRLAT